LADSDSNCLIVFTRYPEPGKCKTRLAPHLGETDAALLAEAFLKDLCTRLASEINTKHRLLLCYDPPGAREQFKTLLAEPEIVLKRFSLVAQAKGDLGERLAAATQRVRSVSPGPLVFIGTDSPDLPLDIIATAFEYTSAGKAYLKPAFDGGYVCLGLPASALHTVFLDIDWSTPDTGRQQAARLRELGVPTVVANSKWWDIDEPEDLAPLLERLEKNHHVAPLTLAALRKMKI
jgi:uncharacterized protein